MHVIASDSEPPQPTHLINRFTNSKFIMTEPLTPAQIEQKLLEENAKELEEAVSEYIDNESCCKDNLTRELLQIKQEAGDNEIIFVGDSLELIFNKQKQLLDYLNKSKPDNYYAGPERYPFEKVMHMMTAMSDEFSEVRAGIPWKHWKTYIDEDDYIEGGEDDSRPSDLVATQIQILKDSKVAYLQKEWIDILHFWVQGAQELGLDAKKTVELYLDKNSENHKRQDEGY